MEQAEELTEAQKLLSRVSCWTEADIADLPELYRKKAEEYRSLANQGESQENSTTEE